MAVSALGARPTIVSAAWLRFLCSLQTSCTASPFIGGGASFLSIMYDL